MKMKQIISLLLAIVMLLGLFTGCGQQGGAAQTGQGAMQTAELNDLVPPRTAEELVPRLNAELKAQDIPLEFVYQGEYATQIRNDDGVWADCLYGGYLAAFTDSGDPMKTETFDLTVFYWSEPTEPMLKLQIWVADDATEREREMHRTVCAIAAQLCDEQKTEKSARELLAAEPSDTPYIVYNGEIGSFTKAEDTYVPVSNDPNEEEIYLDTSMYSTVFCQSADLTHTVFRQLTTEETWYELYFDKTPEMLFGERIFSAPSVAELEQRINDAFSAKGVPITCTLAPYMNYRLWRGVFRWTTLEKEDYAYPEYPYEEWGVQPEAVDDEMIAQYIRNYLPQMYLQVYARDPLRKNAPVYDVQFREQEAIPELAEVICTACDPENGEAALSALQGLDFVEINDREGYQERTLQKDDYRISQDIGTDPESGHIDHSRYQIFYEDVTPWSVPDPTGEELLDPALLDYEFQLEKPMIVDGLFNYYDQSCETYFEPISDYLDVGAVLNDFLGYTRTNVFLEYYWNKGDRYRIHAGNYGDVLDSSVYRIDQYAVAIDVYYNVNIQNYVQDDYWRDYLEKEHILRLPIGISLLMDESITLEEAIALHTHAIEYDFIATAKDQKDGIGKEGFQVTVYDTGDVVHLLTENPETGENTYSALVRAYVESNPDYAKLIEYLDD